MTAVFDDYAQYYDLLYQDKNYSDEVQYLEQLLHRYAPSASTILDLGCGTGLHAQHLARLGFEVQGVDVSETMLQQAHARKASLAPDLASKISFLSGDVRTFRTAQTFDVVVALFHVMSYQTRNVDLQATLRTAAHHLKPGGLFLFDFWYGPAVLLQKPSARVKCLANEQITVTRIAEPTTHLDRNIVDVNYTTLIQENFTDKLSTICETHSMRYLFLPELALLQANLFSECATFSWLSLEPLDEQSWSGIQLLQRI